MWVTPIAKYDIPNTTFNDQENDLSGSIEVVRTLPFIIWPVHH